MKGSILKFSCAAVLVAGSVSMVSAQDTTTKREVVVNQDGTYTVIEYPVGKEVTVNLVPGSTVVGSRGSARIVRSADGTKVYLDVSGVPAETKSYYAYAVDSSGMSTMLGPLTFTNGVARAEFTTPMNQFMVVLSPTEGLTSIDRTSVVFRSDVPAGYAVVPKGLSEKRTVPVSTSVASGYSVPMLNVSSFGNREREVKLKFGGELNGLEAKAYVTPRQGATKVRMKFDDMDKVPANKRFTLWASSPDGKYTKLGQVVNTGNKESAVIESETALTDFGLFVTAEEAEVAVPTSRTYSVFSVS